MRKFLIIILFFVSANTFAQTLPNAGFENWTNLIFFYEPQGYVTTNYASILLGTGAPRANVSRSTSIKGSGTYAAKLESYAANQGDTSGVAGAMITGSLDLANATILPGFPYNGKPQELRALYNYKIGNRLDSGVISVILTKYDSIAGPFNVIGAGIGFLSNTTGAAMQSVNIPIIYTQNIEPDTAIIIVSTSSAFSGAFDSTLFTSAPVGSTLIIDDLSFFGISGVEKIDDLLTAKTYPNPTNSDLSVNFFIAENCSAKIQILSIDGKIVYNDMQELTSGNQNLSIKTDGFAVGIYTLSIQTELGKIQKKIIIE